MNIYELSPSLVRKFPRQSCLVGAWLCLPGPPGGAGAVWNAVLGALSLAPPRPAPPLLVSARSHPINPILCTQPEARWGPGDPLLGYQAPFWGACDAVRTDADVTASAGVAGGLAGRKAALEGKPCDQPQGEPCD